jgi:hypothetical protein
MKTPLIAALLVSCLAIAAPAANAKGCVKGAAAGAVGGHLLHHHGVIGAAAGCAIGHHHAKVKEQQLKDQQPAR